MKVSVIGCGRWGSFLAWYIEKKGYETTLYARETSKKMKELMDFRKNEYLTLKGSIKLTNNLKEALESEYIIISISSQSLRDLCFELKEYNLKNKTIILCMKGIEVKTGGRLTSVVREVLGNDLSLAVWVGPGHVQDFTKDIPNCMVIDSDNKDVIADVVSKFSSKLIRLYIGHDLIGSEIGAAAKNVIGIASGMLEAFNYNSLKGALMARGAREVSRLIKVMGGSELSAYGLCHLGDYEATLFSEYSNNKRFGYNFVLKKDFNYLAEGVTTATAMMKLASEYGVELPITNAVNRVLNEDINPRDVLDTLFERDVKGEFE